MKKLFFMLIVLAATSTVYSQASAGESLFVLFPPNSANLRAVGADQAIANLEAFTQVARLLVNNPQYRLLIDGHANAVINTAREEREMLRPLSLQRAEAAAAFLAEFFDIDQQRLLISGAGGGFPVSRRDGSLNRRVSFYILAP